MTGPMLTVREHIETALMMLEPGSDWDIYHARDQLFRAREVLDNSREITEKVTTIRDRVPTDRPEECTVTGMRFKVTNHKARVVLDD